MAMFWEFFIFELNFAQDHLYLHYFLLWFTFSSLRGSEASALSAITRQDSTYGPYANVYNDIGISFVGLIVIAAIFGTSDPARLPARYDSDTLTKPISKFAYLWPLGRPLLSPPSSPFWVCCLASFSAPSLLGPITPYAAPTQPPGICSRSSVVVFQIFSLGSLFFLVALSRARSHRLPARRSDLHALPSGVNACALRVRSSTSVRHLDPSAFSQ